MAKKKTRSKIKKRISKKIKRPDKTKSIKKAQKPQKVIVNVNKLLTTEEAIKYVIDLGGESGLNIFKYLIFHGPMEENILARKLKFEKANAIRKFLYRLYNKNLVSYTKKKKGAKAWYTYYWKANPERLVFLIKKEYEDEIKQAKKSIDLNKANDFYICENCNRQYDLNKALENDFRCANCNGMLAHMEISQIVGEKEGRIGFLNDKIKKISELIKIK
jgi:transcription initiation factor TFIIE subunit alpha